MSPSKRTILLVNHPLTLGTTFKTTTIKAQGRPSWLDSLGWLLFDSQLNTLMLSGGTTPVERLSFTHDNTITSFASVLPPSLCSLSYCARANPGGDWVCFAQGWDIELHESSLTYLPILSRRRCTSGIFSLDDRSEALRRKLTLDSRETGLMTAK